MKHVMVDIEKLGVIASIGAVEFDGTGDYKTFYRAIDQTTVLLAGLPVDTGSVEFWQQQSPEALAPLLDSKEKVGLVPVLNDFAKFISGNTWLWAKGPQYDCVELAQCYAALKMKVPWRWKNLRDVHTITALAGVEPVEASLKHDALSDAVAQAETVAKAYEKLGLKLMRGGE